MAKTQDEIVREERQENLLVGILNELKELNDKTTTMINQGLTMMKMAEERTKDAK